MHLLLCTRLFDRIAQPRPRNSRLPHTLLTSSSKLAAIGCMWLRVSPASCSGVTERRGTRLTSQDHGLVHATAWPSSSHSQGACASLVAAVLQGRFGDLQRLSEGL